MLGAIQMGRISYAWAIGVSGVVLLAHIVIIQKPLKELLDAALFCPLLMYIIYNVVAIFNHDSKDFFTVYLGTCCIATVYNNRRCLGQYLAITNIINLILVYFRIPLQIPSGYASYSDILIHEVIVLLSSTLLYVIIRFVTREGSDAVRTRDTFLTLMDVSPNMMVIVDGLNFITHLNKNIAQFARIEDPLMAVGRPVLDLFHDINVKLMISDILTSTGSVESIKEIEIEGEARYFLIASSKLGNNTPGRLIYLDDITQFERARSEAEQSSKAKSRFLATMSHEIRTPMNTIIGISDLMPTKNLTSLQKGYFSDIKKMSKSLLVIINDILDFSKIESGKLDILPVHYNARELYDNTVTMGEFIAQGKSLEFRSGFDSSIPEALYGDEIRVKQILTNIINNAVKYTREGFVSFTVSRGNRMATGSVADDVCDETEYLIIEVADSGIGIKERDIPKLFGSFQQFDVQKNRGIAGTGLGLSITKNLVSMMNGYIDVTSVYNSGSTFTVYLPLVAGDPNKIEKSENMPIIMAKEGVQALVVDDIQANLTVALGFLDRHGINAETASGGVEAIEKVKASVENGRPYDIIFMDHMMPDLNGTDATKQIRSLAGGNDSPYTTVPIIAFSANAVQGAKELFLSCGMNAVVSKPIEFAALNAVLRRFLPKEKYTVIEAGNDTAEKQNLLEKTLCEDLAEIAGLDISKGLSYATNNVEIYSSVLRQFSTGIEKGLAIIRESLAAENWRAYTVQVHAYKGVCATIGATEFSEWGKRLEMASKSDDKSLCLEETEAFCSALAGFNATLRRTSLFAKPSETGKTDITAADMVLKLVEFVEACDTCNVSRVKSAIKEMEALRLADAPHDFDPVLSGIFDLARSMDYEAAAEKTRKLCAQLKNKC
jgi:signal transduction histidine kinase/CheY-like chemotaxis protein/HPt (histidine-containing phosphotransfer) domain-containing protein